MISNQTHDATSCRLRRHRSWRVDVARCVAASAIALFALRAVPAGGAEQRPPFLTMERPAALHRPGRQLLIVGIKPLLAAIRA